MLVERELEAALHRVGSISDSNHLQLDKIGWARSSRTDKGVHAARLVVSVKLLFSPQWLVDDGNYQDFIQTVNRELPDDIRVFSCVKINKGFYARGACNWR
jgi:tRNA pseudouridine38-40 synthase